MAAQSLFKILVCDDDPADRKLVRTYLRHVEDREIVLIEAGQKTEIQDALDKGRIDLVFMDIEMPEKSGMEWLAEIVGKHTAPVVMLTGSGSEEVAVQSLQEGAVGYLSKGTLSVEKLTEAVDNAIKKWQQMKQSQADQEELERLANIDSLTGLLNRRAILYQFNEYIRYTRRYNEELSLSMLDIDHFKTVNDIYGHLIGDDVLEKVAGIVMQNIRNTDKVGRYGGEEFIIVLPKTGLSPALKLAERIRRKIESFKIKDSQGEIFRVTASQGIAGYKPGDDEYSLISRADKALYQAKEKGRNRIEVIEQVYSELYTI